MARPSEHLFRVEGVCNRYNDGRDRGSPGMLEMLTHPRTPFHVQAWRATQFLYRRSVKVHPGFLEKYEVKITGIAFRVAYKLCGVSKCIALLVGHQI